MRIVLMSLLLVGCSTTTLDSCHNTWDLETKIKCSKREILKDERPIEVHDSVKIYFGLKP